jgi:hypothetical protein
MSICSISIHFLIHALGYVETTFHVVKRSQYNIFVGLALKDLVLVRGHLSSQRQMHPSLPDFWKLGGAPPHITSKVIGSRWHPSRNNQ